MKKIAIAITAAGAGALAAAAVSLAGAASAVTAGGRADDAVNTLQSQGYSVQINGAATAPLSACAVTNVSGLSVSEPSAGGTPTAYVEIACPQGC